MVIAYVVGFAPNLEAAIRYWLIVSIFVAIVALLVVEWIHRPSQRSSPNVKTPVDARWPGRNKQGKIPNWVEAVLESTSAFARDFCLVVAGAIIGFALAEGVNSSTFKGDLNVAYAIAGMALVLYLTRRFTFGKH